MAPPAHNDGNQEERTEAATQFRREEFRKKGSVALSREVLSVGILTAVGAGVMTSGNLILKEFKGLGDVYFRFSRVPTWESHELFELGVQTTRSLGVMVAPAFVLAILGAFVMGVAQAGFYVTWEPLTPNWDRLNPVAGFQRLWSSNSLVEAVKALLKMAVLVLICWAFFKGLLHQSENYFGRNVGELSSLTATTIGKLFFALVGGFAVLAALDYAYQRYQHERSMRMTKREAKEEFKLREGDPLIKSRIKSIQRRIASRRMMDEVPKADVVVTNPTHLAVALLYNPDSMVAPKVVAKGAGFIAEKIKEIARFNRVPIVENKPLARSLFKQIDIGKFVPRELYKAVAEVLSYVYRIKQKVLQTAGRHV